MRKKSTWETKLVALLLRRRLLLLWVVVGLQLLLVAAIATLLWLTKVQDSIAAYAVASGSQTVVLDATVDAQTVEPLVQEGSAVLAGELLARADGTEITAPQAGVAWGSAYEDAQDDDPRLPVLALIDPKSVNWRIEVGDATGIEFSSGMHATLRLDRLAQVAARPFQGMVVTGLGDSPAEPIAQAGIVALALDAAKMDDNLDWYGLGSMLTTGERGRVLLQVRARRLLMLMLRR